MDVTLNKNLRIAAIGAALVALVLGLGFAFDLSWARALWPWPDTRLSYIFVGSILTAIAGSIIWIAGVASGERCPAVRSTSW